MTDPSTTASTTTAAMPHIPPNASTTTAATGNVGSATKAAPSKRKTTKGKCKYGAKCRNAKCSFVHPPSRVAPGPTPNKANGKATAPVNTTTTTTSASGNGALQGQNQQVTAPAVATTERAAAVNSAGTLHTTSSNAKPPKVKPSKKKKPKNKAKESAAIKVDGKTPNGDPTVPTAAAAATTTQFAPPCRFGSACRDPQCQSVHPFIPGAKVQEAVMAAHPPLSSAAAVGPEKTAAAKKKPKNKKPGLCRFGTDCGRTDCPFVHPVNTTGVASFPGAAAAPTQTAMPIKKNPKKKKNTNTKTRCRYGADCAEVDCHFAHPINRVVAASIADAEAVLEADEPPPVVWLSELEDRMVQEAREQQQQQQQRQAQQQAQQQHAHAQQHSQQYTQQHSQQYTQQHSQQYAHQHSQQQALYQAQAQQQQADHQFAQQLEAQQRLELQQQQTARRQQQAQERQTDHRAAENLVKQANQQRQRQEQESTSMEKNQRRDNMRSATAARESNRSAKEQLADQVEKQRLFKERLEKKRVDTERTEKAKLKQVREKARLDKERLKKESIEKERIAKERTEKERLEQQRVERVEKERRIEQERASKQERIARERRERERIDQEQLEKEREEEEVQERQQIERRQRVEQARREQKAAKDRRQKEEQLKADKENTEADANKAAEEARVALWTEQRETETKVVDILVLFCAAEFCRSNSAGDYNTLLADSGNKSKILEACRNAYRELYKDSVYTRVVVTGAKQQQRNLNGRTGTIDQWNKTKGKYFISLDVKKDSKQTQVVYLSPGALEALPVVQGKQAEQIESYAVQVDRLSFCLASGVSCVVSKNLIARMKTEPSSASLNQFLDTLMAERTDEERLEQERLAEEERQEEERERKRRAEQRRVTEEKRAKEKAEYEEYRRIREEMKEKEERNRKAWAKDQREQQRYYPSGSGGGSRGFGGGGSFGVGMRGFPGEDHPEHCGCPACDIRRMFQARFQGFFFFDEEYDDEYGSDDWEDRYDERTAAEVEKEHQDAAALLEVSIDATADEIKRAYRLKARKYHPDKYNPDSHADGMTLKESEEHFKHVVNAYDHMLSKFDTPGTDD